MNLIFRLSVVRCAIALLSASLCAHALAQEADQQVFELRVYKMNSEEKSQIFDRTVNDAYLPALKRAGAGPVGVFKVKDSEGAEGAWRYMVISYKSADDMLRVRKEVGRNSDFEAAAEDYLSVGKGEEIVERIESSLLLGFEGMPKMKVPSEAKDPGKRFFELRIYESLSEMKGALKVRMFNKGELAIFEKVGLNGVFYGEALVASNLPQLSYLLVYEDEEDKKGAWERFLKHPDWLQLKDVPEYQETVSKIISKFLVAMDYSQIK